MIYHSRDCRHSPMFPHCNCGAEADHEELERLRGVVASMRRLTENAETIVEHSSSGKRYDLKVVHASDIIDVIEGRTS